jgi:hypothetical protein
MIYEKVSPLAAAAEAADVPTALPSDKAINQIKA